MTQKWSLFILLPQRAQQCSTEEQLGHLGALPCQPLSDFSLGQVDDSLRLDTFILKMGRRMVVTNEHVCCVRIR